MNTNNECRVEETASRCRNHDCQLPDRLSEPRFGSSGHQQITRTWWNSRNGFDLFSSQLVEREAVAGGVTAARLRLDALRGMTLLHLKPDVTALARELVRRGGLPPKATADAFHVAIAVADGMDYLLTWNCKHIGYATLRGRIEMICRDAGFEPPVICTPEALVHA